MSLKRVMRRFSSKLDTQRFLVINKIRYPQNAVAPVVGLCEGKMLKLMFVKDGINRYQAERRLDEDRAPEQTSCASNLAVDCTTTDDRNGVV